MGWIPMDDFANDMAEIIRKLESIAEDNPECAPDIIAVKDKLCFITGKAAFAISPEYYG